MSNRIASLAIECIKELMRLSAQEVEEVRTEWLEQCKKEKAINHKFIEDFINYSCDYALGKITSKTA